jgi:hypothetical protein
MGSPFKPPVWIREGTMLFRTVDGPSEALAFLGAFSGVRGAMFHATKIAMTKAVAGEIGSEEARLTFCRFAEDVGILAESAPA